jgi:hypothetical protein
MKDTKKGTGFRGVLQYCLLRKDGKPVGRLIGGNMSASLKGRDHRTLIKQLTREFAGIRNLYPKAAKCVYHNSLRLPKGEKISDEKFVEIADEYMRRMGLSNHQYALVAHDDADGQHLHIICNRVNLEGELNYLEHEGVISTRVCGELEKKYGLIESEQLTYDENNNIVNAPKKTHRECTKGELELALRTGIQPTRITMQIAIDAVIDTNPTTQEFIAALAVHGISISPHVSSSGITQGMAFELDGIAFKGGDLGSSFTFPSLLKRGLNYDQIRDSSCIAELKRVALERKSGATPAVSKSLDDASRSVPLDHPVTRSSRKTDQKSGRALNQNHDSRGLVPASIENNLQPASTTKKEIKYDNPARSIKPSTFSRVPNMRTLHSVRSVASLNRQSKIVLFKTPLDHVRPGLPVGNSDAVQRPRVTSAEGVKKPVKKPVANGVERCFGKFKSMPILRDAKARRAAQQRRTEGDSVIASIKGRDGVPTDLLRLRIEKGSITNAIILGSTTDLKIKLLTDSIAENRWSPAQLHGDPEFVAKMIQEMTFRGMTYELSGTPDEQEKMIADLITEAKKTGKTWNLASAGPDVLRMAKSAHARQNLPVTIEHKTVASQLDSILAQPGIDDALAALEDRSKATAKEMTQENVDAISLESRTGFNADGEDLTDTDKVKAK